MRLRCILILTVGASLVLSGCNQKAIVLDTANAVKFDPKRDTVSKFSGPSEDRSKTGPKGGGSKGGGAP